MHRRLRLIVVIEAIVLGLTWPTVIASFLLGIAFGSREGVVVKAVSAVTPVTLIVCLFAAYWLWKRQPMKASQQLWLFAFVGMPLSVIWFATGTYYHSGGRPEEFLKALVGGIPYSAPFGLIVGLLAGGAYAAVTRALLGMGHGEGHQRSQRLLVPAFLASLGCHFLVAHLFSKILAAPWWGMMLW